jgi:hypothetical protein
MRRAGAQAETSTRGTRQAARRNMCESEILTGRVVWSEKLRTNPDLDPVRRTERLFLGGKRKTLVRGKGRSAAVAPRQGCLGPAIRRKMARQPGTAERLLGERREYVDQRDTSSRLVGFDTSQKIDPRRASWYRAT